jgi:hypothetical protein
MIVIKGPGRYACSRLLDFNGNIIIIIGETALFETEPSLEDSASYVHFVGFRNT